MDCPADFSEKIGLINLLPSCPGWRYFFLPAKDPAVDPVVIPGLSGLKIKFLDLRGRSV